MSWKLSKEGEKAFEELKDYLTMTTQFPDLSLSDVLVQCRNRLCSLGEPQRGPIRAQ